MKEVKYFEDHRFNRQVPPKEYGVPPSFIAFKQIITCTNRDKLNIINNGVSNPGLICRLFRFKINRENLDSTDYELYT